ncbi:class I adenylate-forming enzyme family protein [Cupriavidus basilensis]|uniref:Class I adenylate-forming enzyme family protein n=1 Tax=Cupriavidus basilensis TaxID=68895 RepID=A0ABT6AV14_9BURK|nr:class I adenylate-forming enzyme family protein [Cupriavidus basilensis]MDF3835556.1 class I adenylate-forming enzyme family protein [Cupriavidus basilensis]
MSQTSTDFTSLPALVDAQGALRPRHPAVVLDQRSIDFASLNRLADRVAAALQRDGVPARSVVAICAATSIEYVATFLGSLRAGVAVAPLSPSLNPQTLRAMVQDAGARQLFIDASTREALLGLEAGLGVPCIALDDADAGLAFTRWLAPGDARPAPVEVQPDWAFNLIYSSGTTGVPKGIIQPFGMRSSHVQRATQGGYGPDSVTLLSTPLYSNTTLVSLFPTLSLGGTVVLMGKFDAGQYLELAARHRVTHTMLVPVQYQRILAHPAFAETDLSSFRYKFCTSAPFAAALKAEVLQRWPGALIEYYGMTEGGGRCELRVHEHPGKQHTVGRPSPDSDMRLLDDDGRELPPDAPRGTPGEIVGHSPAMMSGYHNHPAKTAEAEWFDASGKRFIRTGDVGYFDADGFLILMDRKKDMVISGGFNIYPSDIEAVLMAHPDIADAAVVGVPSERWGETPVAFVVPRPGAAADAAALLAWANGQLEKMQRLAALELSQELPRNAIGKVLKRDLRERFGRAP